MPLKHVNEDEITKVCAVCDQEEVLAVASLTLGQNFGNADPDIICLPPCSNCGAKETLRRTWDTCDGKWVGGAHYQQRLAVNALAQLLKSKGQSHQDVKDIHDAEAEEPPDKLDKKELKGQGKAVKKPEFTAPLEHLHPAFRPPKPKAKDKD